LTVVVDTAAGASAAVHPVTSAQANTDAVASPFLMPLPS